MAEKPVETKFESLGDRIATWTAWVWMLVVAGTALAPVVALIAICEAADWIEAQWKRRTS